MTLNAVNIMFTSAKEVMFSSALVSLFLCLFFLLLSRIMQNYLTEFFKKYVKGGTWPTEETLRFWWQSGSRYFRVTVIVGVGVGLGYELSGRISVIVYSTASSRIPRHTIAGYDFVPHITVYVSSGVNLMVRI